MKRTLIVSLAFCSFLVMMFSCQQAEKTKEKKVSLSFKSAQLKDDNYWQAVKEELSIKDENIDQLKIIDKDARKKLRISRDKADKPAKPMFEKINADKKLEIKELLGNENYLKYVSFEENWTKLRREERRKQNKEKRKPASK